MFTEINVCEQQPLPPMTLKQGVLNHHCNALIKFYIEDLK